ncbi:hypothetical protein ITJ86_12380 [Winogradskyella sp. F6397]|uniref:DUF3997 domain-containing protein n=1 Tax=Winogradskyella marina TaxID=2785530 RepID=A0ABS0EJR5_9FLAO|nr:hypothetical protein [Winogradskyella marina]MBF8150700.1 hypothetical protein [Winogradskyella marina]
MRNAVGFIILIVLVLTISCNDKPIEPFELSVADYNYSLAYSVLYNLTNEKLTITFRGELENEKDSVLYSTSDLPKRQLKKISEINIDSLKTDYRNDCIDDGDIKSFIIKKDSLSKTVHLSNYYHPELSPAIEMINGIVPEKYEINYDKADLIQEMKNCEEYKNAE